ncbi:hypothetical protein HDF18_12685 [Mucilaginibacter sp. X5P1]|uniref:hypothetical protein n=1 Tax=Mucilaginibacter sp. X5P1 TaxID=2723088 RepID=UPI00160A530B|nr:hypothetical protein [Mucilaginibacter sp. X5P1]MBB6140320.1 hypothetical protein [Mucilaginibacter sp. X5P1]
MKNNGKLLQKRCTYCIFPDVSIQNRIINCPIYVSFCLHLKQFRDLLLKTRIIMKENFMEVIYDDEKMLFDLKGPSSDDTLFTKNVHLMKDAGMKVHCQPAIRSFQIG